MDESAFNTYVDEMVRWLMEQMPGMATYMGVHAYDHRLADYSLPGVEGQHAKIKEHLAVMEQADSRRWSKEGRIDLTLVVQVLKDMVLMHEQITPHRRNPSLYLEEVMEGIFALIIKESIALEQRLQSLLGRIQETPRVLEQGMQNLHPGQVPRVWAEVALEQSRMGPALFEALLPSMADKFPDLKEKLAAAGREASVSCSDFALYLEKTVLPAAAGDFAVGEECFNTMLREKHLVEYNAAKLLETGWRLFEQTRSEMENLAREIDPAKTLEEIIEKDKADHPSAEELLPEYRRIMESAKDFTVAQEIASIPAEESLRIIETPDFLRPIIPYAAYIPPGIFEENLEGLFLVTPPDSGASPEAHEEKLKGQPRSKIPVTVLHEAYPGHHLQLAWSARQGSTARKLGMMLSALFIEGWAFYCEELMEELGFNNSPIQKLGRLNDQLWRAARIILDVSLHTRGMGVDEAVDFLVERCGLQRVDALAEARRYTSSPTQPQSYLMGKMEIMQIIDLYKKRYPGATLKQMHDAILSCGSLPPKLMREQLFG